MSYKTVQVQRSRQGSIWEDLTGRCQAWTWFPSFSGGSSVSPAGPLSAAVPPELLLPQGSVLAACYSHSPCPPIPYELLYTQSLT